jgi:glycine cleavage system aminomethyltransferase T
LVIPGPDYTKGGIDDDRGAAVEVDADHTASPYELGIGRFVDLDVGEFIGRDALVAEHARPPSRSMVGLSVDWEAIADLYVRQGLPPVVVPTPMWYPSRVVADGSIAVIGFLDDGHCRPGTEVGVVFEIHDVTAPVPAAVVDLPHLPRQRAK